MIRQLAAHRCQGPNAVTVLRGGVATKTIMPDGTERGAAHATAYEVRGFSCDSLEDLATLITTVAGDPAALVIRGALKPEHAESYLACPRKHRALDAPFAPVPRLWASFDMDSVPSMGADPTDPLEAGGAARLHLPHWCRQAAMVAQLTAGAGRKPGIRCRLWPWLDRPVSDGEWKQLLAGAPVDLSLFTPTQPHYVADPIFRNCDDPCAERLAILPGRPVLEVPPAPEPRPAKARAGHWAGPVGAVDRQDSCLRASPSPPRRSVFRATPAERYALACYRAIAEAPHGQGRDTCTRVALKLFGMAKAGLLDPADVAGRIKGAMVRQGWAADEHRRGRTLADVTRQLQWAWDHAEPSSENRRG